LQADFLSIEKFIRNPRVISLQYPNPQKPPKASFGTKLVSTWKTYWSHACYCWHPAQRHL